MNMYTNFTKACKKISLKIFPQIFRTIAKFPTVKAPHISINPEGRSEIVCLRSALTTNRYTALFSLVASRLSSPACAAAAAALELSTSSHPLTGVSRSGRQMAVV